MGVLRMSMTFMDVPGTFLQNCVLARTSAVETFLFLLFACSRQRVLQLVKEPTFPFNNFAIHKYMFFWVFFVLYPYNFVCLNYVLCPS